MTKRDIPAAVFGARPPALQADSPTPKALELWNPGLMARAADRPDDAGPFQIDILGVVGEDPWSDTGTTARQVSALLRAAGSRDIVVNINSPGGNVFEGLTIYNILREHPQAVTVRILGMAASAASVIAMAGDDIQIAKAGFLMIHNVWGVTVGDRNEYASTVEYMAMVDEVLADLYSARSGIPSAEIAALMDRETYMSGKSAVDRGFADGHLRSDDVSVTLAAATDSTEIRAQRRLDATLAKGGMPRSERRALVKSLTNSGTPSAAEDGKPSAAAEAAFASLLATVKSTRI